MTTVSPHYKNTKIAVDTATINLDRLNEVIFKLKLGQVPWLAQDKFVYERLPAIMANIKLPPSKDGSDPNG